MYSIVKRMECKSRMRQISRSSTIMAGLELVKARMAPTTTWLSVLPDSKSACSRRPNLTALSSLTQIGMGISSVRQKAPCVRRAWCGISSTLPKPVHPFASVHIETDAGGGQRREPLAGESSAICLHQRRSRS